MASLGVSETEEHWRMTEKETTTPVLRLGRSLNDPKSPLILGLCPNHVHHRPPSLWYSFRLPLAVFYQDMEIRFSLVEVLEGSCFWRDHIYARATSPSVCDSGTQCESQDDLFWASQGDSGACLQKCPLRTWPESYQEEDGMLVNLNLSWDACPMTSEAQKYTVSCLDPDLGEHKLSGYFGSFPEQEMNLLHSIYPLAHSFPKKA